MILLKVADISNEVRPLEVAEPWIECLLEEFFIQVISNLTKVFGGKLKFNQGFEGNIKFNQGI